MQKRLINWLRGKYFRPKITRGGGCSANYNNNNDNDKDNDNDNDNDNDAESNAHQPSELAQPQNPAEGLANAADAAYMIFRCGTL